MLDTGALTFIGSLVAFKLLSRRSSSRTPYDILLLQNSETSTFVIDSLQSSDAFIKLSDVEGKQIRDRDAEDDVKLDEGIKIAREKDAVPKDFKAEEYIDIDVLGKSANEVADEMLAKIDTSQSFVLVLCGLSGTGKGTTVEVLKKKLAGKKKKVTTWSNGNIFRSVTYLAATYCIQNDRHNFDPDFCLTPGNLRNFMSMMSFAKQKNGLFDTRINGLGVDMLVSEVCNTELKKPLVSKNIPTVAKVTQGEVISFAASAIKTLKEAGEVVLLEGRSQTVDYVRTPYRFTLVLSDEKVIGKRRAAQRVAAEAKNICEKRGVTDSPGISQVLKEVVETMASEV